MSDDISRESRLEQASALANNLLQEIRKALIGQDLIIEQVLVASARHFWCAAWRNVSAASFPGCSSPRI